MDTLIVICAKYLIAVPVILLLGYVAVSHARKQIATLAVLGLACTYGIGKLLSHFFYNARPFVIEHIAPLIPHAADNGFPSDHTLLAAAIAQVLLHYDRRLGSIAWILAILIGAGRVLAHVHHAVDILASASIAIIAVFAAQSLLNRFGTK